MSEEILSAISALFSASWSLFTSWHIPGLNFTPASFFMFILVVRLSYKSIIVPLITQSANTEPLKRNEK